MVDLAWYVLYTAPRAEREAMEGIKRELSAVTFMPTRREETRRGGVKRTVEGKTVFPRYVFLGVDGDPDRCWFRLRDIRGVQNILFMDGRPFRVRPSIVADLMTASSAGFFDTNPEAVGERKPVVGETVRVIAGPFYGFSGKIAALEADDRVAMLMSMFGRQHTVMMAVDQIELPRLEKKA